jgi:hypothetical protein
MAKVFSLPRTPAAYNAAFLGLQLLFFPIFNSGLSVGSAVAR